MILVIFLVWNAVWWAVVGSLLQGKLPGGWLSILALALLSISPLLVLVAGFRGATYPTSAVRLWIMRPFWYGQLLLPMLGTAGLLGLLIGSLFGEAAAAGRWSMVLAAGLVVTLVLWGYAGSRKLVVRVLDIEIPSLPTGLEGMRIVQLSDVHIGPHTSRSHIRRILDAAMGAEPDLIAITGDQVDDYERDVEVFAGAFGALTAALGLYAVPGNHDIYAGWTAVRKGLEGMGVRVLVNEAVPLRRDGSEFWIAGTGDPAASSWSRGGGRSAVPDVDRTLAAVPEGAFVITLAHNPALWPQLAVRGVDLTLSGHTHHGQVSIPRLGWSLASPFVTHAMGLYRDGGSVLYVSPGTNFWGIPLRIGALPEVTVITLRKASVH